MPGAARRRPPARSRSVPRTRQPARPRPRPGSPGDGRAGRSAATAGNRSWRVHEQVSAKLISRRGFYSMLDPPGPLRDNGDVTHTVRSGRTHGGRATPKKSGAGLVRGHAQQHEAEHPHEARGAAVEGRPRGEDRPQAPGRREDPLRRTGQHRVRAPGVRAPHRGADAPRRGPALPDRHEHPLCRQPRRIGEPLRDGDRQRLRLVGGRRPRGHRRRPAGQPLRAGDGRPASTFARSRSPPRSSTPTPSSASPTSRATR